MQREFLKELGLEKEIIDKIMTENGNDIKTVLEALKTDNDICSLLTSRSIADRIKQYANQHFRINYRIFMPQYRTCDTLIKRS